MKSFGLTMAFAIMVSLVVSFTLTPMLSARFLKIQHKGKDGGSSKDSRVFRAVDVFYTRMLEWAMSHRAIVAGLAALVLISSVPLFMVANKNFLPNDDQSEFEIILRAAGGDQPRIDRSDHEPDYERDSEPDAGSGVYARADCR